MKLTIDLKLLPTPAQSSVLLATMERANAAANAISEAAWEMCTFGQYAIHKATYHRARLEFGLSAQLTVRTIGKVADAYKRDKRSRRRFRPRGAIAYDDRIIRFTDRDVLIWTLEGRIRVPFIVGPCQCELLARRRGECDLVFRDGAWFLYVTVDVEEPVPGEPNGWLGVDLGIVNLATDSDGNRYSGAAVNGLRHRHRRVRRRLQAKGSRSARRLLKRRRRKEQRFARDVNHTISKRLCGTAQRTGRGLALEDLRGIRDRVRLRRQQRATFYSWSFGQLREFITYKAARAGVPVVLVDPRSTSRACPACGCVDKANRPHQNRFLCVSCGLAGLPDHFAAVEIGRRAPVNAPYAATQLG